MEEMIVSVKNYENLEDSVKGSRSLDNLVFFADMHNMKCAHICICL